jgi:AcrR family transcriptional regulator
MDETGLRQRKKLRTRETIVTAALDLFAQRGYQQTTVADIAEAAEVSKGTLFAYFPSKEDIVFADTAPLRDELFHELRHRTDGQSALQTLRSYAADHMATPGPRELLRERLIGEDEGLRMTYRARMAEAEDAIAAAIAADLGEPADGIRPRFAAAAAVAALQIAKEHARRSRRSSSREATAVIDDAISFLDGGLRAIATRPRGRAAR